MPAAFYEFTIEESSNFSSVLKVLNPNTGKLFKFIPTEETTELTHPWNNSNTQLNFDVPDEIKLVYPNDADSFGWLQGSTVPSNFLFLTVRMKVKSSTGTPIYNTCTSYGKSNIPGEGIGIRKIVSNPPCSSPQFFEIRRNNPDHNLLMTIPYTETENKTGKYLYDIELEYQLGSNPTTKTPFVLRLLQGRFVFNKNITK